MATTEIEIEFPAPWAVLPVSGEDTARCVHELAEGVRGISDEAAMATTEYFARLLPTLQQLGISGVAALVVVGEPRDAVPGPDTGTATTGGSGDLAVAFAALGTRTVRPGGALIQELTALAEAGSHVVLERETSLVERHRGGPPAVRSATLRHAIELADADGLAPFVAQVRYAFAAGADRAVFVHFETPTALYLDDLTELFDAVAASVVIPQQQTTAEAVSERAPDQSSRG